MDPGGSDSSARPFPAATALRLVSLTATLLALTCGRCDADLVVTIVQPIPGGATPTAGQSCDFAASAVNDGVPVNGLSASWVWSFGDGSPGGSSATTTHVFAGAGTYLVSVTVTYAARQATASALYVVQAGGGYSLALEPATDVISDAWYLVLEGPGPGPPQVTQILDVQKRRAGEEWEPAGNVTGWEPHPDVVNHPNALRGAWYTAGAPLAEGERPDQNVATDIRVQVQPMGVMPPPPQPPGGPPGGPPTPPEPIWVGPVTATPRNTVVRPSENPQARGLLRWDPEGTEPEDRTVRWASAHLLWCHDWPEFDWPDEHFDITITIRSLEGVVVHTAALRQDDPGEGSYVWDGTMNGPGLPPEQQGRGGGCGLVHLPRAGHTRA